MRIPVSQFDSMWQFMFSIMNGSTAWTIPTGAVAVLNGRKQDGNVFAFSGTISGNTVTVDCDVQMTACAGPTVCELSILAGGKVIGSSNFILDVEPAPKSPDDVSSDTTLPAYGEILDRIAEMGSAGIVVDAELSATSVNPVQNKVVKEALDGKVNAVSGKGLSTNDYSTAEKTKLDGIEAGAQKNPDLSGYALTENTVTPQQLAAGLATKQDKVTEVTVATDGAVTQALDAGKHYHFTGALTALTVTLNAPATGELAQYHFDFVSGSTAPTVTIPATVTMPDGWSVEAGKRYEVDILDGYGLAVSWEEASST